MVRNRNGKNVLGTTSLLAGFVKLGSVLLTSLIMSNVWPCTWIKTLTTREEGELLRVPTMEWMRTDSRNRDIDRLVRRK